MDKRGNGRPVRVAVVVLASAIVVGTMGFSAWSIAKGNNSHEDMAVEKYDDLTLDGHFDGDENGVRYICTDGSYLTGWHVLYGSIYYFDENGYRAEGDVRIHGVDYRFMEGSGRLMQAEDGSDWVMDRGDTRPTKVEAKSKGDEFIPERGADGALSRSDIGYKLPSGYKDPDVKAEKTLSGDWYESLSKEEVLSEVLSKTVWTNVVTGDVFHGVDGLRFAFKDADTGAMGGLRLVSNPYGVSFSFSFTGERVLLTTGATFDVFLDGIDGSLGTLRVSEPKDAVAPKVIDNWYE